MTIAWAVLWLGCSGGPKAVCAEPDGEKPVSGDSNGDGRLDIADVMHLSRARQQGGPNPVCPAAVDILGDGRVELGDGWLTLGYLFDGATGYGGVADGCAPVSPTPEVCVAAAFGFEVPKEASGPTDVPVLLLGGAVEAWQLGITAEGCTISGASVSGTRAARIDEGGQRDMGYEHTEFNATGASSAVAMSWRHRLAVDADAPILTLRLQPSATCGTCTLRTADGSLGGRSFDTAFSSDGRSFRPAAAEARFELCP